MARTGHRGRRYGLLVYASLVVRNGTAQFHAESFVEGEAAARIAKVAPRILLAAAPEGIGWVATDMRSYVYAYGGPRELSVKPVSCLGTDQQFRRTRARLSWFFPTSAPKLRHQVRLLRSIFNGVMSADGNAGRARRAWSRVIYGTSRRSFTGFRHLVSRMRQGRGRP